MTTPIPTTITISKSEDNAKTTLTIQPRKMDSYDAFLIFLFLCGLGFITALLISYHFDSSSIISGVIFLFILGKPLLEMYVSLRETQIVTIDRDVLEITRKAFGTKTEKLSVQSIREIKLQKAGLMVDFSQIFLGIKNTLALFRYKIPVIRSANRILIIAEHHDETVRIWITDYLSNALAAT